MSFHPGEIQVQKQAGVREEAQRLSRAIHSVIQPQTQGFISNQQLAAVSSVDV